MSKNDFNLKRISKPFAIIRKKHDGIIQYIINKKVEKEDGSFYVISFFCTELEYQTLNNLIYEVDKEVLKYDTK